MRTCIWCRKTEPYVTFLNKAHSFPKSLGGDSICENVCDDCNRFFGSRTSSSPSVEIVLKEALNLSKFILLKDVNPSFLKNNRYKSEFFDVNFEKNIIKTKFKYKYRKSFQEDLGKLFRRGIYKVFLEEREIQKGDALDERFNFIREFARYDLNDEPIFVFKPRWQAIVFSVGDVKIPMIRFTEYGDDLDSNFRFFEYQIMGHTFAIPTSKYLLNIDNYRKHLIKVDHPLGTEIIQIREFQDIDFKFEFMSK